MNVAASLWENIVQSGVSPICAFDTQFRLTAFNRAHSDEFFRIYGYRVRIGDVFPDLFLPEQALVIRGFMGRALAGETFIVTEEFGDPDLSRPYWEITYTPLRDADGRITGAFHYAQDITTRLRAQAELASARDMMRQSQKLEAMGQLTGGVAHDFNNLLTPIIGTFDLLQRRGMGGEREQRLIEGGLKAADRAKTLVQRLLAFARRQPLRSSAVDVRDLVDGITGLIASTSGPKIAIEVDVPPDLPPAQADPNQLEMAVLNLSVNARDAMPDGGTLTLSVHSDAVERDNLAGVAPGRYVRIRVADTGVGMTAEVLARAIEPFYSTKGIGKGTGLGLSMVHGLAAQLGGGMLIDSAPGKGTRVDLWLPLSPAATLAAAPDAEVRDEPRFAGTALLVDDEDLVRTSTADMLGELGYVVMEATSAEEALEMVEAGQRVDLLVTDHLMAGMSGAELARVMRRRRPDLPILLVSGYAEAAEIAPDLPRLAKPFRQADLAASVKSVATARAAPPAAARLTGAMRASPLSIGILEAGVPPDGLVERHGRYDAMVRRMLGDGYAYRTYDVQAGALPDRPRDHAAYVITGSSAGVYDPLPWIAPLQAFIRAAHGSVRLVGLCFGHQVMAAALGGRVEKSDKGWGLGLHRYDVVAEAPWMAAPPRSVAVAASHQDQVTAPPAGATILAASPFTPYAALAYAGGPSVSVQFHPEFEADFAAALVERRRPALPPGAADRALASLAEASDARRVGGWIARFIDGA